VAHILPRASIRAGSIAAIIPVTMSDGEGRGLLHQVYQMLI
jgi:hypothetical protein